MQACKVYSPIAQNLIEDLQPFIARKSLTSGNMSLKTPHRQHFEKKVHTPPSVERDPGKPKFLKTVPGRAFRRSSNSDNEPFETTGLFVPAPGLSNRGAAPQPLNIPQLLSPPPSVKKKSLGSPALRAVFQHHFTCPPGGQLESPIHLTPSVKIQSLERPLESFDIVSAFKSGTKSEPRTEVSPCDDTIIWTDSVDDPYLEEDSPTYLRSISQNISKVNAKAGHRRFIGTQCAMCDEKICNVLSGEKIVELTCSHASHYQCYLATLEYLYLQKKYPQCSVCGKTVKPSDEGTLEKMMSRLLSRKSYEEDPDLTIGPQWLDLKLPHTADRSSLFTPGEQVIQTADISSNGFRTPYQSLGSATFRDYNDVKGPLVQKNTWLGETLLEIGRREQKASGNENQIALEPEVHVRPSGDSTSFDISVRIPLDEDEAGHQQNEEDAFEEEREFLRQQVEDLVKEEVDTDDELGTLVMFDSVAYSTDGEEWNENIMIYLFDQYLLLFDRDEMSTRGKIPMKQVCQVLKLNDSTLLIDLKSRALPEVYICFPSDDARNSLLQKWKFYLGQSKEFPRLEGITSTSWDILPEELTLELKHLWIKANKNADNPEDIVLKPWQTLQEDIPLQLIICLNLSHDANLQKNDYEWSITKGLKALLGCLNEKDLLGLVAVGKDGRGNVGNYGTFIGTINKLWPHWVETFDSLEAIEHKIFGTPANELDKMLETCLRLVSTADSMLEEGSSSHFLKQVILLREGEPPKIEHKYGRLISDVHNFDLMQMAPFNQNGEVEQLKNAISLLHRKSIKDLTVRLAGQEFFFGNMAPGEEKTISCKFTDPLRFCDVEWFNMRNQRTERINRPIEID